MNNVYAFGRRVAEQYNTETIDRDRQEKKHLSETPTKHV